MTVPFQIKTCPICATSRACPGPVNDSDQPLLCSLATTPK
jgi:hypothetical protein